MLFAASTICLIACHGGPADHFATFVQNLSQNIDIYASGPALKKFQERGITVQHPFAADNLSIEQEDELATVIAQACSTALLVITDVGHTFDVKIQQAIARQSPSTYRFAYYDNPESYIPGGYSEVAAQVMQAASGILFANARLAEAPLFQTRDQPVDFGNRKKIGLGYYPIHQAQHIAQRRETEKNPLRQAFFEKNDLMDMNQKVLVYFGGNNEEYFSKAFPAFLSLLEKCIESEDCTHLVLILQQHPGAKAKNIDKTLLENWISLHQENPHTPKIFISNFSSDDAQVLADGALYYQTSMGPQFVLAGIPTTQIGHETYEDVLIKNHLAHSVTQVDQFIHMSNRCKYPPQAMPQEDIMEHLGIRPDWLHRLHTAIEDCPPIAPPR